MNILKRKFLFNTTLGTAIFFILAGILIWGAFNWTIELTNTESFCISCHEMHDNTYMEYRKSVHFSNRTGVRATCPDCHVPRDWVHKVARKIRASNELYHHFLGSIDSRKKFLDKRQQLAAVVWKTMKQTNSRECRNCHSATAMNKNKQDSSAAEQHRLAETEHKTCIDCHKGIAHKLPEAFLEAEHRRFEKEKVPCYRCHKEMARPPGEDEWK